MQTSIRISKKEMNQSRMKIKLVTFAPPPNFGTCLQAYALNYVLREMGHDVEFIYNRREVPPLSLTGHIKKLVKKTMKIILPDGLVNRLKERNKSKANIVQAGGNMPSTPYIISLPQHRILKIFSTFPFYQTLAKHWYYTNLQQRKVYKFTFLDNNFRMRRLFTHKDYIDAANDADLFITGSDQIWNPFCGGYNPMMFLEFVNDGTKCISYSSSISQPQIHPMIEERMAKALSKFNHIAVREQRSVELLNELLHRTDIKLVVDPTYLLSSEEWERFGNKANIEFQVPEKYIFCYFVGNKRTDVYKRMVEDVKHFTGIEHVINLECSNRNITYGDGFTYQDAGPYEWVYLLRHASYICMDSFHATVFALKFHKEFVHAMKNMDDEAGSQNTRMYDILSRYGILYKNYNGDNTLEWQQTIDYNRVDPIIKAEIEDSMDYLRYEIRG